MLERVDVKRAAFSALDADIGPDTIVGSSSSGIPASQFTEHIACRARCLIAHPVNPPYLVPVVELVPAPWTTPETVAATRALMERVKQKPVAMTREIEGFLLNRLQAVLLMEAWQLVKDGLATVEDIDTTVSDGLGLRWAFMGPFETIDLNAPGGVADYAQRLGALYHRIAESRAPHAAWDAELIGEVERQRRVLLEAGELPARTAWRDRQLMALARHKGRWGSRGKPSCCGTYDGIDACCPEVGFGLVRLRYPFSNLPSITFRRTVSRSESIATFSSISVSAFYLD